MPRSLNIALSGFGGSKIGRPGIATDSPMAILAVAAIQSADPVARLKYDCGLRVLNWLVAVRSKASAPRVARQALERSMA